MSVSLTKAIYTGYVIWFARTAKKAHKYYKPSNDLQKKSHLPRLLRSVLPSVEIGIAVSNARHATALKTGVLFGFFLGSP